MALHDQVQDLTFAVGESDVRSDAFTHVVRQRAVAGRGLDLAPRFAAAALGVADAVLAARLAERVVQVLRAGRRDAAAALVVGVRLAEELIPLKGIAHVVVVVARAARVADLEARLGADAFGRELGAVFLHAVQDALFRPQHTHAERLGQLGARVQRLARRADRRRFRGDALEVAL